MTTMSEHAEKHKLPGEPFDQRQEPAQETKPDPIRLFVGTSACNEDLEAEAVLAWSARRYSSLPVEITWMRQSADGPWSGWKSSVNNRTPFSSFRWGVPSACDYTGRAIYSDVDFLYLGDLAEVWTQPIPNVALVRNPTGKLSTSFIVFDCAKAREHVPPIKKLRGMDDAHSTMLNYFRAHPELLSATNGNWDCPDLKGASLDDPNVKAVHFTRIESQIHLKHAVPRLKREGGSHWYKGEVFPHPRPELQARFDQLLAEAEAAGEGIERYRHMPFDGAARKDFRYKSHVGSTP
jgi:hypothetical protein